MTLPTELAKVRDKIRQHASACGLDFFEIIFEVVDFDQMNQIAAYAGFPTRYPHWRFGMEYERLRKSYAYGLHRIYEMVVNNDPCYAYLLQSNKPVDQKTVMAHVYAHSDFFKNNPYFAHTNRKMMDEMANHGTRIRRYVDKYGQDQVEEFIDVCLSVENLIDAHASFMRRRPKESRETDEEEEAYKPRKMRAKDYMDRFINPPELLAEEEKARKEQREAQKKRVPPEPVQDVILFLIEHAPLEQWQADILDIIREEAYYFAPQRHTKILNEGWSAYWHSTIMTQSGVMTDAEVVDYADHHSGTVAVTPGRLNPYKLGLELFRDIEERWDKGRFGKDYAECDDMVAKRNWDLQLGLGRQKIFEVRMIYNDVSFVDAFLTEEFCQAHKLFTYRFNKHTGQYEIETRDFQAVKQKLLTTLTNFGQPFIYVEDANYGNRGDLYLRHRHEGIDLKLDHARDTLANIHTLWSRPVHLETIVEGARQLLTFDGQQHTSRKL